MMGFEWKDIRGVEGTGFVRVLRTILTSQLPQLLPSLETRIADEIHIQVSNTKTCKPLKTCE